MDPGGLRDLAAASRLLVRNHYQPPPQPPPSELPPPKPESELPPSELLLVPIFGMTIVSWLFVPQLMQSPTLSIKPVDFVVALRKMDVFVFTV